MKIEEINHNTTLQALARHPEIKIEEYDTIEELRKAIKFINKQNYRKKKAEYFRTYMRDKYRREAQALHLIKSQT
jgi:3-hydroxy-3-methylglutaryl CoA synthase